jgi:hypothetical protein
MECLKLCALISENLKVILSKPKTKPKKGRKTKLKK